MTLVISGLLAAVLLAGVLYVAFVHNRLVFVGFALVLALAPAAQVPVVEVSVLLLACLGLWVGLATKPRTWPRPSWVELLVGALVIVSLFPLLAHGLSYVAVSDYVRWAAAVLVAVPLRVLSASELATVARVFARGTVVAAVVGIGLVLLDPGGGFLTRLSGFGYTQQAGGLATADTSAGLAARLVGPYAHPNVAAFLLIAGLVLAAAFLRGRVRAVGVAILALAVALTLSRAALAGLLVMALVLVVAGRGHGRARAVVGGGLVVGGLALLAVPAVRARIVDSFGPRDLGSSDRWQALRAFPEDMGGHWWLGRGFGAPEFIDPLSAGIANMAANAVLHMMLRGGLVVGLVLAALLLAAAVAGWRRIRSGRLEAAVVGAGVIGLVLVPIQLDIPLVTSVPVAATFSLLLAVLAHPDVFDDAVEEDA